MTSSVLNTYYLVALLIYKEHRHGKNLQVRLWSVPLWSAIITSIATRACVPKFLSSSCFVFHLYLVEF